VETLASWELLTVPRITGGSFPKGGNRRNAKIIKVKGDCLWFAEIEWEGSSYGQLCFLKLDTQQKTGLIIENLNESIQIN
jgi:hypothetical protein